ncbi:MAG TPA: Zn-ribbon domain-containing OB-fold protein [Dehalococcoidia bacterium]|nr:Zn-ribbon domain-containing OB-fold protein [Dehalococcoidia bacterium]
MVTDYRKPLPIPLHREASRPFWEAARRHELLMPRCRLCDRLFFYPREVCPVCLRAEIVWQPVSGRGRLHSYTVIHQPANPAFTEDAPYVYAMVQLDEGPRMIANLVDCPLDAVQIDMPLVATYDDVTPEVTLVRFRPAR